MGILLLAPRFDLADGGWIGEDEEILSSSERSPEVKESNRDGESFSES